MQLRIKRVYEPPAPSDGTRVLVDRLWPRGLTKEGAEIDIWAKEIAPSGGLRKWFAHKEEKVEEFTRRYRLELETKADEIETLLNSIGRGVVTLLYAARNEKCNHAVVLKETLERYSPDSELN